MIIIVYILLLTYLVKFIKFHQKKSPSSLEYMKTGVQSLRFQSSLLISLADMLLCHAEEMHTSNYIKWLHP